jgi:glucose-1-phosphate adenylyltransferase
MTPKMRMVQHAYFVKRHTERPSITRLLRETLAVVLAGGRGTRLGDLTSTRCKPAVPFAGNYRLIDFTLSNCINSGLRRISILTQYRSHSLIKHIEGGWSLCRAEFGEFVELLPAQERSGDSSWYQGTADAVFQNLDIIREHEPELVLVLAGDHIYKMDYGVMVARMIETHADAVVGCVEVPIEQACEFGIMQVDAEDRVIGFDEKPCRPKALPGEDGRALASMGIYLFKADFLYRVLETDSRAGSSQRDFGKDIIPSIYRVHRVHACPFRDLATGGLAYWRDVGTLDAYWRANLEMADVTPPLDLYDEDWPIRTSIQQLPPAKFVFNDDGRRGMAVDSLVSAGCIVSGAKITHSVLSSKVRVESGAEVVDSVILPGSVIGERCRIRNAVIDGGCKIPPGMVIGESLEEDRRRFFVSPGGVILVCSNMLREALPVRVVASERPLAAIPAARTGGAQASRNPT